MLNKKTPSIGAVYTDIVTSGEKVRILYKGNDQLESIKNIYLVHIHDMKQYKKYFCDYESGEVKEDY